MIDRASRLALNLYTQLRYREQGQAAVEYGVLLALIVAIAIAAVTLVGGDVRQAFQDVADRFVHS